MKLVFLRFTLLWSCLIGAVSLTNAATHTAEESTLLVINLTVEESVADSLKEETLAEENLTKAERKYLKDRAKREKALAKAQRKVYGKNYDKKSSSSSDKTASTKVKTKKSKDNSSKVGGSVKRKADRIYKDLGYMASAEYYEELVQDELEGEQVMEHLANAYRLNADYETAEYWYSKIINNTANVENLCNYALVLQANRKCEDAVRWYEEYQSRTEDEHRTFIENCADQEDFKQNENVKIDAINELNTSHLDFSAIPYEDGVIITSTRSASGVVKHRDLWTDDNFTDLFYCEKNKDGSYEDPLPLIGDLNGKFHDGVPTFTKNGKKMYFTRNNLKGKAADGTIDLKIYSAKNDDGQWKEVEELPFNSKEYATAHPTLSPDGKRLYFASDRPGGYGKMDLYYVKKLGSTWSEPVNLGPTVNSSGSEIFPFMSKDEELYFASNGHRGLGGLDIFVTAKTDLADEGSWALRENLGEQFNTNKDDFAFVVLEKDKKGFLSSSREGDDDIYQWTMTDGSLTPKKKKTLEKTFCVIDADSHEPISQARVTVLPKGATEGLGIYDDLVLTLKKLESSDNEYVLSFSDRNALRSKGDAIVTNKLGEFTYPVAAGEEYIFIVEKNRYERARHEVATYKVLSSDKDCYPLKIKARDCFLLEGLVKNKNYGTPIPYAEVQILDKCSGEVFKTTSDEAGYFDHCLNCNCEYEISAAKQYFSKGFANVSTQNMDCPTNGKLASGIDLTLETVVELVPQGLAAQPATPQPAISNNPYDPNNPNGLYNPNSPYYNPNLVNPYSQGGNPYQPIQGPVTPEALREYFLGDANNQFREGQIIALHHVYYDYDKYYIRDDASEELDYVAALMKFYPSMQIALESHTDSRATDRYNNWLSRKRAESAAAYLMQKGVESYRITSAKGMGERRLTNRCADEVDCTEDEHQMNRRTEIKVTRFEQQGVQVRDSEPVRR
ncbi:MAG: OmpA family protein [Saprospiraceae bacterium]